MLQRLVLHGSVGAWLLFAWSGFGAVTPQTEDAAGKHWAYQPITRPALPGVKAGERVAGPIDAFLLARLEEQGLSFAPLAEPRTLLRRVYYDLIGLPPTFEETEAFASDPSDTALAAIVDRLLADARYGQRWGRHWLDVARYADTKDLVLLYGRDAIRPYAYTFRDYVIRAFNEDLPLDQFIRDQLAADLEDPKVAPWRLAGLGFLTLGRLFDNNPHDQIDDQIDTVARGLLGLTVACARCHDHKYDRISMEDYYGLYGVFASTERPTVLPLIEDPRTVPGGEAFERQLESARLELEDHIDQQDAFLSDRMRRRIGDYLVRAATTPPDLTETTQFALSLTPDDFRPSLVSRTRRFLEARLKVGDRVWGPWAALMEIPEEGFSQKAGAWMRRELSEPAAAARFNARIVTKLTSAALAQRSDVPRLYGEVLLEAYLARMRSACSPDSIVVPVEDQELLDILMGNDGPVWFARRDTPDHMSRVEKDRYGGLVLNLDKIAAHASNAPPARAMVVADLPQPYASHVFQRGSPARPGKPAPRGFLGLLNGGERQLFGKGSGRLELAAAITSPRNPLTARVLANRVWMHHFGEPLAASTTDFGARSEPPVNPALLDWLASELISSGWRLKPLHRLLMLSTAYRQAPAGPALASRMTEGLSKDPDNRLLWHFPRHRLDLESMRDSLLYASGRLDPSVGGRPVDVAGDALNRRRTVYGLVDRQNLPGLFRSFDFAMPDQCVERRPKTSVPQQALFALNSAFVQEQARALAKLAQESVAAADPASAGRGRVEALFQRVLGRRPLPAESERALRFITGAAADGKDGSTFGPWEQFAQVLLVSNEAVFVE